MSFLERSPTYCSVCDVTIRDISCCFEVPPTRGVRGFRCDLLHREVIDNIGEFQKVRRGSHSRLTHLQSLRHTEASTTNCGGTGVAIPIGCGSSVNIEGKPWGQYVESLRVVCLSVKTILLFPIQGRAQFSSRAVCCSGSVWGWTSSLRFLSTISERMFLVVGLTWIRSHFSGRVSLPAESLSLERCRPWRGHHAVAEV